ncbi:MAG: hypothetical protein GY756_05785 [bacterium]|nr:hypothetical protein [bacterium]
MRLFSKYKLHYIAITATICLIMAGCLSTNHKPVTQSKPSNLSYAWLGYPQPCPTPNDAKILIEKWTPKTVSPNSPIDIKLSIKNNADYEINKLLLREYIPNKFVITKITPAVTSRKDTNLLWQIDSLKPSQSKSVTITGLIKTPGSVRYTGTSILNFETKDLKDGFSTVSVIAPDLDFELSSPTNSIIYSKIPINLVFKNDGTAPVNNVKLVHTLPKGLLTYEGKSEIDLNIGTLSAKETKNITVDLQGIKKGKYQTEFTVVADNNLKSEAGLKLLITQPEFKIILVAPNKRFVGDIIPYTVKIKNIGNAPAENTVVQLVIPDGTNLTSMKGKGSTDNNKITWEVDTVYPNEIKTVAAKALAKKIMSARAVATVTANASKQLEIAKTTDVAGISALLCKLIDTHDPVPVGEEEIYELTVTNQGSLPATKIKVKCYLEDSMEYVKSSGASKGSVSNAVLDFEPLPSLEPNAEAKWKIHIKAVKAGDARFKVEVIDDHLTRPVTLIEPTNFYD